MTKRMEAREEAQTLSTRKLKRRRGVMMGEDGLVFRYTPPPGLDFTCCMFGKLDWKGPQVGHLYDESAAKKIFYFEIVVEELAREGYDLL